MLQSANNSIYKTCMCNLAILLKKFKNTEKLQYNSSKNISTCIISKEFKDSSIDRVLYYSLLKSFNIL